MVDRCSRSASSLGTAISQEFSKPRGAIHQRFHRRRNSERTRLSVSSSPPFAVSPRMETSPVPVYSG